MAGALLEKRLAALEHIGHEEDEEAEEEHGRVRTRSKKRTLSKRKRKKDDKAGEEDVALDPFGQGPLTDVDLSAAAPEEQLGDDGVKRLREALTGKATSLRRLNLRRAGLGVGGFREVGLLLFQCPALEELVLSNNNAGSDSLKGDFSEAIDDARSLKVLELQGCGLRDEGLEPLCAVLERMDEALRPVVGVKKLNLGTNNLTFAGARRLATMLATNMKLEELDLADNNLREEGGKELAVGLVANKGRLHRLNASQNRLKVAGARPLFDVFLSKDAKFTIRINRTPGTKHGFMLGNKMVVTGLEFQGWVEQHGKEHPVDAVFIGDRIIDVNGYTEETDMMHEMTVGEVLDVTLTRDGVCMEYLDICYNALTTTGAEELRALVGMEKQGSLMGNQLRFDGGSRIVFLNAE